MREWRNLDLQEQAAFKVAWGRRGEAEEGDADDEGGLHGIDVAALHRSAWMSRLGNHDFPVDPAHVEPALVAASSDTTPLVGVKGMAHGGGVWKRFYEKRSEVREACVVKNRDSLPTSAITLPAACWQVHPGLCVTEDAAIYDKCLEVARHIERYFVGDLRHNYFCLIGSQADQAIPCYMQYMYFAHSRARRRKTPVTHVFVKVARARNDVLTLETRGADLLAYQTSWSLAKAALHVQTERLQAVKLAIERTPGRRQVCWSEELLGGAEVWPAPAKRAKKVADPDEKHLKELGGVQEKPKKQKVLGAITFGRPERCVGPVQEVASHTESDTEKAPTDHGRSSPGASRSSDTDGGGDGGGLNLYNIRYMIYDI